MNEENESLSKYLKTHERMKINKRYCGNLVKPTKKKKIFYKGN